MNKKEFGKGIEVLELSYNQKFDENKLEFWYRQLKDLSADRYFNNIQKLIKTNSFMPNIAQIRNESSIKTNSDYEQRDYSNFDFNNLYANKQFE